MWKRINMAEKLDSKEMVTPNELIYSNMMQIEAITRLLVKKGIITKDELQAEYKELMREAKR
jgi:polyhydroxyalkanoate synthesis regulator phasin